MKLLFGFAFIIAAAAYGRDITCDEKPARKSGTFERFVITMDDEKNITQMEHLRWNAGTDTKAGSGDASYNEATPLKGKIKGKLRHYHFSFSPEVDGDLDFPVEDTDVYIRAPRILPGHGSITVSGEAESERFEVYCR